MAKTYLAAVALIVILSVVVASAISPPDDDIRMSDFYDWLARNYKNFVDKQKSIAADKRSDIWQFKNSRCNPLYDWNCNSAWGRAGRRR